MSTTASVAGGAPRKISVLLMIGIVLMPYAFAWFLLRPGYSQRARFIAFGWMALLLLSFALSSGETSGGGTSTSAENDPRSFSQFATDAMVAPGMNAVKDKVARDFEAQYQLAVKSGDLMSVCAQARVASAAYLQAQDEPTYLWAKKREKSDCERAGLSF